MQMLFPAGVLRAHLTDWSFYVSDNRSVWVVKEFYSDLGNVTGVTSATKHFVHFSKFYWLILSDCSNISWTSLVIRITEVA